MEWRVTESLQVIASLWTIVGRSDHSSRHCVGWFGTRGCGRDRVRGRGVVVVVVSLLSSRSYLFVAKPTTMELWPIHQCLRIPAATIQYPPTSTAYPEPSTLTGVRTAVRPTDDSVLGAKVRRLKLFGGVDLSYHHNANQQQRWVNSSH